MRHRWHRIADSDSTPAHAGSQRSSWLQGRALIAIQRIRELLTSDMTAAAIGRDVGATTGLAYNVKSAMSMTRTRSRKPTTRQELKTDARIVCIDGLVSMILHMERERASPLVVLEPIQNVLADTLA